MTRHSFRHAHTTEHELLSYTTRTQRLRQLGSTFTKIGCALNCEFRIGCRPEFFSRLLAGVFRQMPLHNRKVGCGSYPNNKQPFLHPLTPIGHSRLLQTRALISPNLLHVAETRAPPEPDGPLYDHSETPLYAHCLQRSWHRSRCHD